MRTLTLFCCLLFVMLHFTTGNAYASTKIKSPHFTLPSKVRYIENKNQWEDFIRYKADFRGGKIFLENNRFTYVFFNSDDIQSIHPHEGKQIDKIRLHAIKVHAINGNEHASLRPADPSDYFHNYFIGNDPSKWASKVKLFSAVTYEDLYPDIDQKFYSSSTDIKYDFIVRPGGNADNIALEYEGTDDLGISEGALMIKLSVGTIMEQKPYAYQLIDGEEKEVPCKFVLKKNTVSFRFPHGYNKAYPLIIDPTLVFSSYTGSSADNWGFTATYDAAGDLISGGNVNDLGYPVTAGAYQLSYGGGGFSGNGWSCDMAIAKFNPSGTTLLYATYLGGSDNEQPQSLVVDGNDNLIIFGTTYSSNFPTTAGSYDASINGLGDMTISKLSSDGSVLLASTYVGGSGDDGLNTDPGFTTTGPLKYNYSDEARGEIIFDSNNDYIVASCSQSLNFPTTAGVLQPAYGGGIQDGVLFKINSSLTGMVWSTFIGGSSDDAVYDVVIDGNNDLYIAGGTVSPNLPTTAGVLHPAYQGGRSDGFIEHIANAGNLILAATYIGTSSYDQTYFIELDYSGNVYTTGQTEGIYPVTAGVYSNPNSKQFIHKMDANLTTTFYSTVFGTGGTYPNISPTAFLVDTCENVYVAGWGRCLSLGAFTYANVNGMPVSPNAYQSTTTGCDFYFFVLNHDALAIAYATFFGGSFSQEHVDGGTSRFDKNGVIYESVCAGCGGSSDFPTTPGVVSNTNNSFNCNNGVIKLAFNLARTVSAITTTPAAGCAPFTITMTNSSLNATSFVWDFGDGTPQDFTFQPTHTFVDTGVYTVMLVALNNLSCNQNDTSYATITVTPPIQPVAAFNLIQSSSCDTFTVSTIFTGSAGNLYHWDFGDGFTTNGPGTTHTYNDTGTYVITLINTDTLCPNADTVSQTITFSRLEVSAVAAATSITNGCSPLTVSFNSNGSSGATHFWNFMDGSPLDTSSNPSHTFLNQGNYDVIFVVSDPASCNGSDTVHITISVIQTIPLFVSFNLVTSPPCDTMRATVDFTGSGGNIYQWNFGDGFTTNGLGASHIYADSGSYTITLIVTDTVCPNADTISQTVSFHLPAPVFAAASGDTSGCAPVTVTLNSSSSQSGIHFWNFMDGSPVDTSSNPTHTFLSAGTYDVIFVVSDPSSCNGSDTAHVTINVAPVPPLVASFSLISNHSCDTLLVSTNFNGIGGTIYHWDFGDGSTTSGLNASHVYTGTGTYFITLVVSDTACPNADSVWQAVAFNPAVDVSAGATGATTGCAPFIATFSSSTTSPATHFWNFMDGSPVDTNMNATHTFLAAGQYDVIFVVIDPASCNGSDTAHVLITIPASTPLLASFNVNSSPLCDNLWANVNFTGTGGNIYSWDFGDGFQSGGINLTHYYTSTGTYNITLFAEDTVCDRLDSVTHSVTFLPSVSAGVNTNNVLFGCIPQTINLTNTFTSEGNYWWDFGDSTFSTESSVEHTYNDTGTYLIQLIVSDSGSCNLGDTAFYTLSVYQSPVADFSIIQHDAYFYSDVDFFDHSMLANLYSWDFADGTFSASPDSIFHHRYENGGVYNICLYVTTSNGCIDTTCKQIYVEYAESIYVPNAITLNGDGANDVFRVYSVGILELDVAIFNRWGEQIYEYKTTEGGWNGKYNGNNVQEDVYVYRIRAKGLVHPNIFRIGTVTVVK